MWKDLNPGPLNNRAARIRQAWDATVAALPVGTSVGGVVHHQRRSGIFVELDDYPDAMAFADITTFARGAILPAPGARISGIVIDHVPENCQVRLRLTSPVDSMEHRSAGDAGSGVELHKVTLVVEAPGDLPGYEAQFEPEGGIVLMEPGDRITVTMTGPTPPEIMVYPYPGGLSIWRCFDAQEITVTDKDGNAVEGLY